MNKRLSIVAGMCFGLFLSNNAFCMDALKSPEFAFVSDIRINLDEIKFGNINGIIDGIHFNFDFFKNLVSMYCRYKLSYLSNSNEWVDSETHGCPFCNEYDEFSKRCETLVSCKLYKECELHDIFYAQKLFIDKKSELLTISDLHADFDALVTIFNNMHNSGDIDDNLIIKSNKFLIGLGDYVDRKDASLRTILFLLIVALKNPGRVILLRGNHEDLNFNLQYGIDAEIKAIFGEEFTKETYKLLVELYELMPSVLYVSQTRSQDVIQEEFNDFLIFSHALLDFKFDPRQLLDFNNDRLMRNGGKCFGIIEQSIEDKAFPDVPLVGFGFIWHDIGIKNSSSVELDSKSNRYKYKPELIRAFCKKYSSNENVISGMVGGHDHHFAMRVDKSLYDKFSAVGYVKVFGDVERVQVQTGIIDAQYTEGNCFVTGSDLENARCFSMVKFVSAPMDGVAYKPTYMVISRCVLRNMDFWNYKVVEGR